MFDVKDLGELHYFLGLNLKYKKMEVCEWDKNSTLNKPSPVLGWKIARQLILLSKTYTEE